MATVTAITRYNNVDAAAEACDPSLLSSQPITDLPDATTGNVNRALAVGPDSKLYVSLGSASNGGGRRLGGLGRGGG